MPLILTSRTPWRRLPSGPCGIDRSHPLATGLTAVHPLTASSADAALTRSGATFSGSGDIGDVTLAAASSQYGEMSHGLGTSDLTAATLGMWFWRASTSNIAILSFYDPTQTRKRTAIQVWSDGKIYTAADAASGVNSANATMSPAAYTWHRVVMTYDGAQTGFAQLRLYINGTELTLASSGTAPDGTLKNGTGHVFRVNVDHAGSGTTPRYGNAAYAHACAWNRTLTPAEIAYDYAPSTRWSLYQPLIRRTYFDLGGGATFQTAWVRQTTPMIGTGLR